PPPAGAAKRWTMDWVSKSCCRSIGRRNAFPRKRRRGDDRRKHIDWRFKRSSVKTWWPPLRWKGSVHARRDLIHRYPMLHERQNTLLTLLSAAGGQSGALEFQKLLFLYCQELQRAPSYQFVPYKFGGFSFTSYADKRKLIERGLLWDDESSWRIAQPRKVDALVKPERRRIAEQFLRRYSNLQGNELVAETYRRYPYYAIRSEIAQKLLDKDPK